MTREIHGRELTVEDILEYVTSYEDSATQSALKFRQDHPDLAMLAEFRATTLGDVRRWIEENR